MQTTIRVRLSEINASFLEKLQSALGQLSNVTDPEIDIVLNNAEYNQAFVEMVKKSSQEMKEGKVQIFTVESLRDFVRAS